MGSVSDQERVSCSCGKRFKIRDEHRGRELLCPVCNSRFRVPGSAAKNTTSAKSEDSESKKIDWKYLGPGIAMAAGGAICVAIFVAILMQGGAGGRGMITLPVIGGVLLLMGLGSAAKGLLGDKIEWD